jgi:hypothetical protein
MASIAAPLAVILALTFCAAAVVDGDPTPDPQSRTGSAQVPTWSARDLDDFLHGSMSTEVVPEVVLRSFVRTYPDLFPTADLSHFGLIPDPAFGWPIGFSRRSVPHLGGLSAVGLNCAACHVGEVFAAPGATPVRVLGMTAHFDAEAYFGAVAVASFRTAEPANMKRFLAAYLDASDGTGGEAAQRSFEAAWERQAEEIAAAIAADPAGSGDVAPGALHEIAAADLRLDRDRLTNGADLAAFARTMLRLFHNMRAALHVPHHLPAEAPPASGPGRNDAFGLLSASFFGEPQPFAPVKYGLVWNLENRRFVHWDANTSSPIGRNVLASLGLGAPLLGRRGQLDLAAVQRHTDLSERIRPPRYPWGFDAAAARRGAAHYAARCASCHDGPESDRRLYDPAEVGTDPRRAQLFTPRQAERFNRFLAELQIEGYRPSEEPGIRSTQKYWAPSLAGVWARSPYLHNGSVRTMLELLSRPADRAKSFRRGARLYEADSMGHADAGAYVVDTAAPGNGNAGHDYGTDLSAAAKRELIEHLKTL